LVSVIKKPTSVVEDVEKTPTMLGKNSALPVDLEDPKRFEVTVGRIRSLMDTG
jgi:hypothetical protein